VTHASSVTGTPEKIYLSLLFSFDFSAQTGYFCPQRFYQIINNIILLNL